MGDQCPKCGYDNPPESMLPNRGGQAWHYTPHIVGGLFCLQRQLSAVKAARERAEDERDEAIESNKNNIVSKDAELEDARAGIRRIAGERIQLFRAMSSIMEALAIRNGGTLCDNPIGPCACGAWHNPADMAERIMTAIKKATTDNTKEQP